MLSSPLLTELKPSRLHCVLMRRIDLTTHFHQCQRLDIKMLSGHTDDNNSPREGERERERDVIRSIDCLLLMFGVIISRLASN